MTSRELLRAAARELAAAGVPDPAYDAGQLLAKVTGMPALELRAGFAEISAEQEAPFRALMDRRKAREPLQYLLGDTVFLGRSFQVRPGVLIPRPETEMLAENAIRWVRERSLRVPHPEVLDLCCGSGCIGLTVKAERPDAIVTLSDISRDALDVAAANAARYSLQVSLRCGDLAEGLPPASFDCVVSNPPYIPSAECGVLQPEVLREPSLALDGGADGMDFYRRISDECVRILRPDGILLLELGYGESDAVSFLLAAAGFTGITVRKDFSGIARMMLAVSPARRNYV